MTNLFEAVITKPPTAHRFHAADISGFLTEGETVSEATVVPNDPALLIDRITTPNGLVRWRVREGENEQDYIVTVTIATNLERKEPMFILYRVRQPKGAAV